MSLIATPSTPDCFGKSWEPKELDCSGGYNPSFRAADGTHTQPRCDYFDACRSRTMAGKLAQAQAIAAPQLIPAQSLNRSANPYVGFRPPTTQTQPTPPPAYQQAAPQPQQVVQPQVQQIGYGQYYVPPSHVVPPYLMTPEVRHPDESWWAPLVREMLRGVFKAMGQTFSSYLDRNTFRKPPQ